MSDRDRLRRNAAATRGAAAGASSAVGRRAGSKPSSGRTSPDPEEEVRRPNKGAQEQLLAATRKKTGDEPAAAPRSSRNPAAAASRNPPPPAPVSSPAAPPEPAPSKPAASAPPSAEVSREAPDDTATEYVDEFIFKIAVVGDVGVGKTAALASFKQCAAACGYNYASLSGDDGTPWADKPPTFEPSIGVDFSSIVLLNVRPRVNVRMQFWDVSGAEKAGPSLAVAMRSAAAAIVVYDVTKPRTLEEAKRVWIPSLLRDHGMKANTILALGTKGDLLEDTSASVTPEDLTLLRSDFQGLRTEEISVKLGIGVMAAMRVIPEALLQRYASNVADMPVSPAPVAPAAAAPPAKVEPKAPATTAASKTPPPSSLPPQPAAATAAAPAPKPAPKAPTPVQQQTPPQPPMMSPSDDDEEDLDTSTLSGETPEEKQRRLKKQAKALQKKKERKAQERAANKAAEGQRIEKDAKKRRPSHDSDSTAVTPQTGAKRGDPNDVPVLSDDDDDRGGDDDGSVAGETPQERKRRLKRKAARRKGCCTC
jgi:hypothetical protein